MADKLLSKIFLDVYCDYCNIDVNNVKIDITSYIGLEEKLNDYIKVFLGYRINFDYTLYFREIKKYFKNVIANCPSHDINSIISYLEDYSKNFYEEIQKRPYSSLFINAIKPLYSNEPSRCVIEQLGSSYKIGRITRKDENEIPSIYIQDIDKFENTLQTFVESVIKSDTHFNSYFDGMEPNEALSYLFEWVVKNVTTKDMGDIEQYFRKYNSFITDTTLEYLKTPVMVGRILGHDLFIMLKKANVNYETPYYLSFILQNETGYIEMPNIRLGIETEGDFKVAHILATQTAQSNYNPQKTAEINEILKKMFGKSKHFREFNPSHLFSIVLSFGILKGVGIDHVKIADYLPLRYQRLVLENQKGEFELESYQYRLTNKNINTYLRTQEKFQGMEIESYPELGDGLSFHFLDSMTIEDEFLKKLYQYGYQVGNQTKSDNKQK